MDDSESSALYRLPLAEFTAARDKLATDLAREGEKDAAEEVKGLHKPTVAAWAVNLIAHEHAGDVARLFELRERLADAGDPRELRRLAAERRRLISKLVSAADDILERAGHASSATTREKITRTLQAGETLEERELVRAGRLSRDLSPSGFGDFGFALAESVEEPSEEQTAIRRKAEALATAATEAERQAAELERAAARAEQQAQATTRAAAVARRKAEVARERADKALDDL